MSTAPEETIHLLKGEDGSYWLPYRPNGETCGGCASSSRLVAKYLREVGVQLFKREKHPITRSLRRIELPQNVGLIIDSIKAARLGVYGDDRAVEIGFWPGFSLCDDRWHLHTVWHPIGLAPQRSEELASVTPEPILAA